MNFTDTQKKIGIAVIATLIGAFTLTATQLSNCLNTSPTEPTPEVSSSPTPSSSPSPLPSASPSSTPTGTSQIVLKGVVGETVSAVFAPSTAIASLAPGVRAYEIQKVTTLVPSFKGAAVGDYEDPLKPVTSLEAGKRYWVEVTLTAPGTSALGFVTAVTKPGPMKTVPFYMELQFNQIAKAHNLPDEGSTLAARCALALKYVQLLRAHGVEPIKQHPLVSAQAANGVLDLDGYFPAQGCTFRQLVLNGAIAPPMIFTWSPSASDAQITATKASLSSLPVDSWSYVWDEGEPAMDAQSLAQAKRYKTSGLKLMQTHRYSADFAPYIDWFCPVVNFAPFSRTPECLYTSCMANATCQNTTADKVGTPTGHPMMVLDAPSGHAVAFPLVMAKLGAARGLYFNSTQMLPTAWNPGGLYSEGGDGDGTLLYPGTDGLPWPSLRLKRLYRGLQDAYYLGRGMVNPVTGPTTFPQTEDAYEAARLAAWDKL